MCQSKFRYWILFLPKICSPSYPEACAPSGRAETARVATRQRRARRGARRAVGRIKEVSFALLREEGPGGLDFFLGEHSEDPVLERQQVLEHPLQGVGLLPLLALEVLEVVRIDEVAGLAVVDLHQDVVLKTGLLDQDLPVVGL